MKKVFAAMTAVLMTLALAACGATPPPAEESAPAILQSSEGTPSSSEPAEEAGEASSQQEQAPSSQAAEAKGLVVYFSWSGNTELVATEIQKQTGADIFALTPETPYTEDYNAVLDVAQEEQKNNARPAISAEIENFADYDTIYVGFPIWWADMPMLLYTFFDSYELSGKTIAPFCTSGGSGFSNTIAAMEALEPQAVITEGLHIGTSGASDSGAAVTDWLNKIGLAE